MRHICIRALGACLLAVLIVFVPKNVYADTFLNAPAYSGQVTWTKEGSPYILNGDLLLESTGKLTIEKGVIVKGYASTTLPFLPYLNLQGNVRMLGTEDEPIQISGLGISHISGNDNTLEHVMLDSAPLIIQKNSFVPQATTTINSIVVTNTKTGLQIQSGGVTIENSEFTANDIGIRSDPRASNPAINIKNSIFEKNKVYNVENGISKQINAADNWWGNANGPGTSIVGPVAVDPWKTTDPRIKIKKIECCSNVLFLPGLEASRLYREDKNPLGVGTSTHRSWEPYTNADVKTLYLDENGSSTNPTIYTKDILDAGLGIINIYKGFIAMMNGVVAEKTVNEWLPFAYDWRFSPEEIVKGTKYPSGTKSLVEEVARLASTSKTGKVTIIAHSYGGLVAKMLGQELEKQGKAEFIDKVIFVGVPQLGTPQAIAAMLHGTDQGMLQGLILKDGVARTLGLHMPGAYSLLPSAEYFTRIMDPVITFADKAVGSFAEFSNFLSGGDGRTEPKESDTSKPAVLTSHLLGNAGSLHTGLDNWHFPTFTEVASLVGWGTPTTRRIEYGSSTPRIRRAPEGDGTVVAESAGGYSLTGVENIYFNQGLYDKDQDKNITHPTILEAAPLQEFISKVVSTTTLGAAKKLMPEYLSQAKPVADNYPWMKWLTISVHSPVDLDITDDKGKHMGPVLLSEVVPEAADSDLMWFENTIGGQYEEIGDEKYFTVPADSTYAVKLKGTGVGNFTFQVQKFVGGDMTQVANVVYEDLPVTPLLEGSTTISSSALSAPLILDVNGDGVTDIQALPGPLNPLQHLDAMNAIILSLKLDSVIETRLLQKIDKIRSLLIKGDKEKVIKKLQKLEDKILKKHWKAKELSETEKESLASLFEGVLDALAK